MNSADLVRTTAAPIWPPSVRAIFAWANERFSDHWPGLFAIGFLVALVPLARMVLEQGDAGALHPWVGWGFVIAGELVLLLGTAAMVLLVIKPPDGRSSEAMREALADAPRLVAVKIAAGIVRWLPALALAAAITAIAGPRNVGLTFVTGVALLPLAFVSQIAFASAVIERTGPIEAVVRAFRRATDAGLGTVFALAILIALVEQSRPWCSCGWATCSFRPPACRTRRTFRAAARTGFRRCRGPGRSAAGSRAGC